jgi:hypothetical protein
MIIYTLDNWPVPLNGLTSPMLASTKYFHLLQNFGEKKYFYDLIKVKHYIQVLYHIIKDIRHNI